MLGGHALLRNLFKTGKLLLDLLVLEEVDK